MKKCTVCKTEKDETEFNRNKRKSDGLQSKCKECSRRLGREYYANNKSYFRKHAKKNRSRNQEFVLRSLDDKCCVDCGETDPVVLEYDHLGDKKMAISEMVKNGYGVETISLEMDKCVVRCANCHRRKTAKERGYYKYGG